MYRKKHEKGIYGNQSKSENKQHTQNTKTDPRNTINSNHNEKKVNTENLNNFLDSGPYGVIDKNKDDSKIINHPMKMEKIIKEHQDLNLINMRKIGSYKIEIEFQNYTGANNFIKTKLALH